MSTHSSLTPTLSPERYRHHMPIKAPQLASLHRRVALVIAIASPLVGLIVAMVALWGYGFRWIDLMLLASMYVLTVLGITVGFHRLFTHHSFEANRGVQFVLAVLGSMSAEGPLLEWVAMHRLHHQHSDQEDDPHSPHHRGKGITGLLGGLLYSHIMWLFIAKPKNLSHYVKDLEQNPQLRLVSKLFPLWVTLGLVIPAAIGGWATGTWAGALMGFVWGGLVRIGLVHHVTWSINSACHVWGKQPYDSGDESRNNALLGILALGEGWHNTHHAFPTSARHGLGRWQIDVSYLVIRFLEALGLAWNVKLPKVNTSVVQEAAERGIHCPRKRTAA